MIVKNAARFFSLASSFYTCRFAPAIPHRKRGKAYLACYISLSAATNRLKHASSCLDYEKKIGNKWKRCYNLLLAFSLSLSGYT